MSTRRKGLTRRSLLKRAGLTGAALGLGLGTALVIERTVLDGEEGGALPYLPGFNDDFVDYSHTDFAGLTMERVRECGGRCIRFVLNWGEVQAGGEASFDYSAYDPLHRQAVDAGIRILPILFGCPEWADPVMTAERRPGQDPEFPADHFRTPSPEFDAAFGRFADATLRHFDAYGQDRGRAGSIVGAEILNEPNSWTFGAVPADRLRAMTLAAAGRVSESQAAGVFSSPMRVISGGLAPVVGLEPGNRTSYPPRPSWEEYLTELIEGDPAGFEVGFHSYETAKPPPGTLTIPEDDPADPSGRAGQFAAWQASSIIAKVDRARSLAGRNVWLTETGASSASTWSSDLFSPLYRAVYGQGIQAEVLTRVAVELKSRPECRSMIVHRLYSDDLAEPAPTAETDSPHYQDGVYNAVNRDPKAAVSALAEVWT